MTHIPNNFLVRHACVMFANHFFLEEALELLNNLERYYIYFQEPELIVLQVSPGNLWVGTHQK